MNSVIWKKEFDLIATKQHVIAAWVAVILNPLWAISDYFIIPSYWKIFLLVRLVVTVLTLAALLLRKTWQLNHATVVLIPFLGIALQNAYMYSVMDVVVLQQHTFAYIALFIGAGMLLILRPVNSLFVILITCIFQIIVIKLNSPISAEQILFNGGFLVITVAIFNIVLTAVRFRSIKNELIARLEIEESKNRISEQKNIIEKSAAELADINEKLNRFAYVISHDLKAPLRGINHLVGWIEEETRDKLRPESQEYINLLRTQVDKMDKMIKGILDYSRTGNQNQTREWVEINKLINEVLQLLSFDTNVRVSVFPGMPVMFYNKTKLAQVFQNLISNAVKHNNKPNPEVKIFCIEQPEFFEFSVEDNGPGIAQKNHEKVFEIFQTLSTNENDDNTGVGLPIVKKIIEENAGKIWIESATKSGTVFKFILPKVSDKGEVIFEKENLKEVK